MVGLNSNGLGGKTQCETVLRTVLYCISRARGNEPCHPTTDVAIQKGTCTSPPVAALHGCLYCTAWSVWRSTFPRVHNNTLSGAVMCAEQRPPLYRQYTVSYPRLCKHDQICTVGGAIRLRSSPRRHRSPSPSFPPSPSLATRIFACWEHLLLQCPTSLPFLIEPFTASAFV